MMQLLTVTVSCRLSGLSFYNVGLMPCNHAQLVSKTADHHALSLGLLQRLSFARTPGEK